MTSSSLTLSLHQLAVAQNLVVRHEDMVAEFVPLVPCMAPFGLGYLAERGWNAVGAHLLEAGGVARLGVSRHRAERDVVGSALALRRRVDVTDIVARARIETIRPAIDELDRPREPAVSQLEIVVARPPDGRLGRDRHRS